MKNEDVRNAVKTAGLKLWQVADALNMTDATFSRKLRHELDAETKERIFEIVRTINAAER